MLFGGFRLCLLASIVSSAFSSTNAQGLTFDSQIQHAFGYVPSTEEVRKEAFRLLEALIPGIDFGFLIDGTLVDPFNVERSLSLTSGKRSTKFTTRAAELFTLLKGYFEEAVRNPLGYVTNPQNNWSNPWSQMTFPLQPGKKKVKVTSQNHQTDVCNDQLADALHILCACSTANEVATVGNEQSSDIDIDVVCGPGSARALVGEDSYICYYRRSFEFLLKKMPRLSNPVEEFARQELLRFADWLRGLNDKCSDDTRKRLDAKRLDKLQRRIQG